MNSALSVHPVWSWCIAVVGTLALGAGANAAGPGSSDAPPGRSIAYAATDVEFAVYETDGAKEECPEGLAVLGPREQFKLQFPNDGTKRSLMETQLARETEIW